MRILVLIHEFPPVGGGGGRAAYDICKQLVGRGHEIVVLTAHLKGLPLRDMVDGIQVVRIPSLRSASYSASMPAMAAYILLGLWHGLALIRRFRPDLLHVHFALPAGALAWALSALTGLPYALTAHLGDVPGGVPEKTDRWFRWLLPFTPPIWRRASRVAAVSHYTRQLALRHYPVEIEVIYNGVDVLDNKPAAREPGSQPCIVFAGRFVPQKDPLQIVRALAGLRDLDWQCVLLGDGELFETVKQSIHAEGLDGRFTLTGWVTPEEVLAWFAKSDILFMPSFSEGLPVVGVQALASGLAVVASHIGGFLDIVDEGQNGFLAPPGDQAGFAGALRKLLTDPSLLRQFQAASLRKAAQFDILRIATQYETLFKEAIHDH
ncbi:MAG: glycosyltransferase family 4 protein [Chloroflexota bacterium]